MRIISKFQDYYDSALAFGHDDTIVYVRKEIKHKATRDEKLPKGYDFMFPTLDTRAYIHHGWYRHPKAHEQNRKGREFSIIPFTVVFCGKLYPGIRLLHRKAGSLGEWTSDFAYSLEAYVALVSYHGLEFTTKKKRRRYSWDNSPIKGSPKRKEDCEEYFARSGEDHVAFFAEKEIPIAYYAEDAYTTRESVLMFNTNLKDVAFFKVFDAYTAFQELDMFVGGVMTQEGNPMAGISDEDLRDKKGFDKMSFKTPPTKKR